MAIERHLRGMRTKCKVLHLQGRHLRSFTVLNYGKLKVVENMVHLLSYLFCWMKQKRKRNNEKTIKDLNMY